MSRKWKRYIKCGWRKRTWNSDRECLLTAFWPISNEECGLFIFVQVIKILCERITRTNFIEQCFKLMLAFFEQGKTVRWTPVRCRSFCMLTFFREYRLEKCVLHQTSISTSYSLFWFYYFGRTLKNEALENLIAGWMPCRFAFIIKMDVYARKYCRDSTKQSKHGKFFMRFASYNNTINLSNFVLSFMLS